jgi:transcriptional regulator with XRE-family HTH domain
MVRQYGTPQHEALRRLLIGERKRAGLSQNELSRRLRWSRQTISKIETGEKRVTVVELLELAAAIGFDPMTALRRVSKTKG